MKSLKSYVCLITGCLLTGILFSGCKQEAICVEEQQQADAKIVSVSGPATLKAGEQATITVGVRNDQSVCVLETKAVFTNIDLDTLRIQATLEYTKNAKNDCNCKKDSVIYTLLYFTPLNNGTYHIIAAKDSSALLEPGDNLGYTIDVE